MTSSRRYRNNASFEVPDPLPRMVSEYDISQAERAAQTLPPGAIALEFGPWLGALSVAIAPHAELHVVDSFEWTKDHAKRVADLLEPGESFRAAYQHVLEAGGLTATIHESRFEDFRWSGGEISLLVIDAPKKARDLADCLRPVLDHLKPGARLLIKNALHPQHWQLGALLDLLIKAEVFQVSDAPIEAASNMLELVAGSRSSEGADLMDGSLVVAPVTEAFFESVSLAADHPYRIAPILFYFTEGEFEKAYDLLSRMKPERRLRTAWKKHAPDANEYGPAAIFTSVFDVHHSAVARKLPESLGSSRERLLRSAWLNTSEQPDRANRFQPEILEQARGYGYMSWPNKVREIVYGKRILDVGCGPGLHGLGYLAVGAATYLGVDPIIKPDRDRVKNLSVGGKMKFGWTPNEISAHIEAWDVLPIAIEELPDGDEFDLAILHNVTEHLPDVDAAFASIAGVLRPGGHILYNHDNFYSWNGHHCAPKRLEDFDPSDPAQLELVDWGHLDFVPPPDHYIARGLNRIGLDDLIALTERLFKIEQIEEVPSSPATGVDRLTDDILARHPDLTRRDLTIKNLFCLARRP